MTQLEASGKVKASTFEGDGSLLTGINISNISKVITEEFEHLSEKMTELGEELTGKKKVRTKVMEKTRALRSGSLL